MRLASSSPVFITVDVAGTQLTLEGRSFGAEVKANTVYGEVVFQTGMVGYPESLSDPSYYGQILVLTYPLIGSYGVPDNQEQDQFGIAKNVESERVHVRALVVGEYIDVPSHHQSVETLHIWLARNGVPGIEGIDTRKLTQLIRDHGVLKGVIHSTASASSVPATDSHFLPRGLPSLVCQPPNQMRFIGPSTAQRKVMVIDCGIKNNQLRMLMERLVASNPLTKNDVALCIVSIDDDFAPIFNQQRCERIFISNGPGDPRDCDVFIARLSAFMNANVNVPIFGICLGHQLLSLAAGFEVTKLKYGNRGHNLPCQLVGTTRVFQTTQNHGYATLISDTSDHGWSPFFVNLNDGSNEGIIHEQNPWMSVQFHPEARAGPQDTALLFDIFIESAPTTTADVIILPSFRQQAIDRFAAIPAQPVRQRSKVLVLGSGGLCIGQSGEFDYSGSQAIKAFKEEGLVVVLVNPNIATVQTTPGFVDRVYFLPITPEYVEQVIGIERPDCIALSFGGQSALGCGIALKQTGVLERYGVEVLGTPVDSIIITEDRQAFKLHIQSIGESIPDGAIATTVEEAVEHTKRIGYPVLVRAAFTLGGQGSGFAATEQELRVLLQTSFSLSTQVIIDKSFRGWKELEYEIVRDRYGNCISVCNMENLDPLGVHTGESIVVAPSQTLTDADYNRLRSTALRCVASLGIVGECNIQYAVDPSSNAYYIIEINARLSRSSALASKATGYPLAYVAAKLGLGYGLHELKNSITGTTTACSEPSLDYCVVKVPRWDLKKFQRVNTHIGSAMKSVGEGMAISRSFEEALQSAIRMTGMNRYGIEPNIVPCTDDELRDPTYRRILAVATGLCNGVDGVAPYTIDRMYELSGIDKWFLTKIKKIVDMVDVLRSQTSSSSSSSDRSNILLQAKKLGFSDAAIAHFAGSTELVIRAERLKYGIRPDVKQIDTVAGEFPCRTNYLYLTYATTAPAPGNTTSLSTSSTSDKVIVLGGGVYQIGSSVEFDCCAVSCVRELRAPPLSRRVVMINCNPETVSTDYDEADTLYFSEISLETVLDIQDMEHACGVIVSVGGQLPNNIAMPLHLQGVRIIGTSAENIDGAENRKKFSRMLDRGGIDQPEWKELESLDAALAWSRDRYPVLVRPSYVLSGAAMNVAYSDGDLRKCLASATDVSRDHPVVISKFIHNAKELEVDAVAKSGEVCVLALSEHVENAGVHSGDATVFFPAQDVTPATRAQIQHITRYIARALDINGPFNIQFIAKDDEVKVIECNLRVSRSVPFISKTMGVNLVANATRMMIDPTKMVDWNGSVAGLAGGSVGSIAGGGGGGGGGAPSGAPGGATRIGVKVAQFSFNRLVGADILLGVEMQSTGEVACFGRTKQEAYIKALTASGFKIPTTTSGAILLSIGGHAYKKEFKQSVEMLTSLGFQLYATRNTASYYNINELRMNSASPLVTDTVMNWIEQRKFAMIINVTERNKMRCVEDTDAPTIGYLMRQAAIANNIPIMTDIKTAKLLVSCLPTFITRGHTVHFESDCFAAYNTVRIPGLIDVHVHVRDPGETHKEDWESCTKAAIAGGITMICAMPNTKPSLVSQQEFGLVESIASKHAQCDYALFAGATTTNTNTVHAELGDKCVGLKMYLNNTHGDLLLPDATVWMEHIKNWTHPTHPICVHAEGQTLAAVLFIAGAYGRRIHVCHVSSREEIVLIKLAKQSPTTANLVTCEVAPHHLFLDSVTTNDNNDRDVLTVKPPLRTQSDQQALWDNMDIIDCFATDHAPHLLNTEKRAPKCCPGFPGLETALALLLSAVQPEGYQSSKGVTRRLTLDDIVLRYHTNPKRIFGLPDQPDTFVELDMAQRYTIPQETQMCKSRWTPFAGMQCVGAIKRVVIRGETRYISDKPFHGMCISGGGAISTNTVTTPLQSHATPLAQAHLTAPLAQAHLTAPLAQAHLTAPLAAPQLIITRRINVAMDRDLLSATQFTKDSLRMIFECADDIRRMDETTGSPPQYMKGKTLGLFFYEPSTRTRVSFEIAMKRMGGHVVNVTAEQSSVKKGETLEDSIASFKACGQTDAIVLRHPDKGSSHRAAQVSDVPIINAGDGSGEHPTQTLIDLYTIRRELGSIGGICVVFVGDLKYGRTVHSLVKALSLRADVRIHYVAPPELSVPPDVYEFAAQRGLEQHQHTELLDDVLGVADVIYVTRIQRERHNHDLSITTVDPYCITPAVLAKAKPDVRILHPLPRGTEISVDVDKDSRAAYKRQMENGPYVRMALLNLLINHTK